MTDEREFVPTKDDLHAYVDGKLSTEHASKVEDYLKSHPVVAAEVADYRRINTVLRSTVDDVFEEPVPPAQISILRGRHSRSALAMAAALAGLIVGAVLTWFLVGLDSNGGSSLDQLASRSGAAYLVYTPETRHPVEVGAADADHLSAWLSDRMGMSLKVPKLGDLGLELVGGRLMIGETAPAALLMYENAQGRRVVLYVRNDLPAAQTTKMRYVQHADAGVVVWADGTTGFGLAGAFTKKELMPAAHLVRAQLSS